MSLQYLSCYFSCGFLFPKSDFKLIFLSTIGYISDNAFYRINLQNFQTQIVHHPEGRSYQAFTSNFKRRMIVLVDYGKNPTFYFQFQDNKEKSFEMNNVCNLQVLKVELSLDGKYLAVLCGIPTPKIIIINIQQRKVLSGSQNFINLQKNYDKVKKIQFNPGNHNHLALMFEDALMFYQIKECFELNDKNEIQQGIQIKKVDQIIDTMETFIWDQINNVYLSNSKEVYIYSTDTRSKVLRCDIQLDIEGPLVTNLLLTKKHLIIFYRNGRVEWLNKYYPDLMEEEDISLRPFYLDKMYQIGRQVVHACYDGQFQKILLSLAEGCFAILPKAAETKDQDEQQEDNDRKKQKSGQKKLNLEMVFSKHYHRNSIFLIHQIPQTNICVTISEAGRVIFWSIKQKKQIETYAIPGGISCADINLQGNVIAIGYKTGLIRFYSIAQMQNIFLFKQFRMVKSGSIDQIKFSSNGEEVAVLSKSQNKIFYILTNLTMEFQVLGYLTIYHQIKNISWMKTQKCSIKPKYQYLLVCIGYGILMINGPTPIPTKKRGKQLELTCDIYAMRTDPDQYLISSLPSGELISAGQDKIFKKYKQPEQLLIKIDFKSKLPPSPPIQQIEAHDFKPLMIRSQYQKFLSAGVEGSVHIRDYNNFKQIKNIKAYGWRSQTIKYISLSSSNKGVVYVSGSDGSFYVWKLTEGEINGKDQIQLKVPNYKKIQYEQNVKYYQVIIEEQYLQKMKDIITKKKKTQFEKLQKIKKDLKLLLQENQKHEELQRLSRDQFAIDLQSRDKAAKIGQQQCLKIREESKRKILQNQVYAKKLKQITWDRMDVHLSAINGLKNNYLVYNYQIRKISQVQKRRVKLILDLRRAQKKQQKKMTSKVPNAQDLKNKNIVNGGVIQPLIMTTYEKKDQKKDDKKKKKQEEVAQDKQQIQQIPTDQEWSLLYTTSQLFSDNSKKNQIIMMKNLIIKIKETFNKEFNKLMKFRQNQNQMINDKNKRIIQICQELKKPSEVIIGHLNILESSEGILKVSPDQIPFKRYLSKEEREKLEKERLKEQERLRKLAEDDSSIRALQQMMGGTLQQKKVSALEINVQKQKWMDKPVQQMNQDQKVKMKEYEQKKQKAQEQKERIVKKLEAQLRKLKQQIDDIMQKYDEKLFQLLKRKIQYDYRIQEQELYCARLILSMINETEQTKRHKMLKQKVNSSKKMFDKLKEQKQLIQAHQEQFQKAKQAKKAALDMKKLGQLESKIKTIEKSVFQQYNTNIKKRRQMEQKYLAQNPTYKHQIINLDPMKQIQSKYLSIDKGKDFNFFLSQIKVLQQTFDIPQNSVLQILENRFNIKKEEAQYEIKHKHLQQSITNMEKKIQENHLNIVKDEDQILAISQFLQQCKSDLDIQIRIKQGQVQISNQKPVPDLEDALLISKNQIDEKNVKIKIEANQKISVMKEIKTCKIKVTEQTLNLQKKQQHIDKLGQQIRQIQMLKVKKQMQVALSKKDTKINQNQLKSLKEQIQKVRKEGQKRISLFQAKIDKILKQIQTIKKQNKQLQMQKWTLESTVKQREKIKDMMCGDQEAGQEAAQKFDQISINRKLFDKAKQQTQQIQLLREELSKLKAKTFANFSNVQR